MSCLERQVGGFSFYSESSLGILSRTVTGSDLDLKIVLSFSDGCQGRQASAGRSTCLGSQTPCNQPGLQLIHATQHSLAGSQDLNIDLVVPT